MRKNRKCWFVDLSLILRNSKSQTVIDIYTNSYSMFTWRPFQNCKIYLLPDGISNWAQIFTDHGSISIFIDELFLIGRLNNSRTTNNRRFFTISDFKIYLLREYIWKMAKIFIKYFSEHNVLNICKRWRRAFLKLTAKTRNMIFLVIFEKISKKKVLRFFESRLQRKPVKHWWESWLTSRYFEVLVVKFKQTLFFNFIF
jgi:hypothetical protein